MMIRVKNLDNIHFNVTVLSNWFQSSIFKAIPGVLVFQEYWFLRILSTKYIFSSVTCSPFKIYPVMKLDL